MDPQDVLDYLRKKQQAAEALGDQGNQIGAPIQARAQQMGNSIDSAISNAGQAIKQRIAPTPAQVMQQKLDALGPQDTPPGVGAPTDQDRAMQIAAVQKMNQQMQSKDRAQNMIDRQKDAQDAAALAQENKPRYGQDQDEDMSGYKDVPSKWSKLKNKIGN